MNYIGWALAGMVGYSFTTLFVKLATQDGTLPAFRVLAASVLIDSLIVRLIAWAMTLASGGAQAAAWC